MWNYPKGREESHATMSKIEFADTTQSAIVKMAEGNPGALTAMVGLLQLDKEAAPDGGIVAILHLDDEGIYESRIWMGFKDYCGQDAAKFYTACVTRDPAMLAAARG